MLSDKLPDQGLTIFSHMTQLAHKTGAINLSQGFPDFAPPAALLEAAARHLRDGNNQYAPMAGIEPLRQQVALKIAQRYQRTLDHDTELTIVPGATEAIFCAIQTLVHPGDEVILLDPSYDSYAPSVQLAGGRCVHVPLQQPGFTIDWQRLTDAFTVRTRMLIINSPHNPSGALFTRDDLDQLATLLRGKNVWLLSDEVYEHLVYDGRQHASVLAHDELYQRALVISSFGKTYHVTGWKTGYVAAPPTLTAALRKVHQYVSFCGVTPIQHALAEFMASHPQHLEELPGFYQARRDFFCRLLGSSKFHFTPTPGTYFQLADYSAIRADLDDVAMVEWLAHEAGVAAIPISVFYREPPPGLRLVRFCFAKQESTLQQAAERLCAL